MTITTGRQRCANVTLRYIWMVQNRRQVLAKEMPVACLRHVVCQTETELQFDGFFVPLMTRSLSYETATEQASLPIAIVHTEREGSVCFSFFLYHGIPAGCITQKECERLFASCLPCCPFWKGRSGKKSHGLSDESDWWMNVDDSDHLLLENCPFCSHFPTRVLGAVREGVVLHNGNSVDVLGNDGNTPLYLTLLELESLYMTLYVALQSSRPRMS